MCQKKTTLVPRCAFQIDLVDRSDTTTALISGNLAEKVLFVTANDIFHTTCIKWQLLPIKDAQDMLEDKLFHVQLRKTTWRRANVAQSSLTLVSYREVEAISPSSVDERSNKRAKSVSQYISKIQRPTTEGESSSTATSIKQPPTATEI